MLSSIGSQLVKKVLEDNPYAQIELLGIYL